MRPEEKAIRERRTIEATKKNLMGLPGKLGTIVRTLGNPIVRHGSSLEEPLLDDPYETPDEDEIPVGDEAYIEEEGWTFDGLSSGLHIEIQYYDLYNELKCYYRGFLVYREIAGELTAYAPFPEWEDMIDRIYRVARKKAKEQESAKQAIVALKVNRAKKTFLDKLRLLWGI